MKYKAFISYKHLSSTSFAERLELAIKAYAKPIWRPPMSVFRDEKYLRPGVNLPELIRRALDDSEYLIYLASPEAAQSEWVQDELEFWCSTEERLQRLIVVLTAGHILADPGTKLVDWQQTNALPQIIASRIVFIPLYVELSWARTEEDQSLLNPDYKKAVNLIVATLRNMDPIELSGVEILQHRRNVRIRNTFIASIIMLAIGLAIVAGFAWDQMRKAQWRAIYSEALRLSDTSPNMAIRTLSELSDNTNINAAPLAWRLINETPVWTATEFRGHGDMVWSLAFDPGDGRLATGGGDGTVRLWTLDESEPPVVLQGHRSLVLDIDFAPDGKRIGTVAEDDAIRIWDRHTGLLLKEIPVEQGQVNHIAFNQEGSGFMTATYRNITLYDDEGSGTTLAEVPRLIDVAWRPDGKAIATASSQKGVGAQLHWVDGRLPPQTLEGTEVDGTYAINFSPDGSLIAVVCLDGTLRLFRGHDGTKHFVLRQEASTASVAGVVQTAMRLVGFSPDGLFVGGAFGPDLYIWQTSSPSRARVLTHESAVEDFDLGKGGEQVITLDNSGNTLLWTTAGGNDYQSTAVYGHAGVSRVALTPDGEYVVTAAEDGTIRRWVFKDPMQPVITIKGHGSPVHFAAFSPDGSKVVTASEDGTARLWLTTSGQALDTLYSAEAGSVNSALFSTDGQHIVVAGEDGAFLWAADGKGDPLRFHNEPVKEAAFSADGNWIMVVTGSQHINDDGKVFLYPSDGHGPPKTFNGQGRISLFSPLSPDGKRMITFSPTDQQAIIYLVQDETASVTLKGHQDLLLDASFSPDGRYAVTASSDWTMRLWEVETGQELMVFTGAGTEVEMARFNPDGSNIMTMSAEHMIRLWDLNGRIVRKVMASGAPAHVAFSHEGGALLIVENSFGEQHLVRVLNPKAMEDPILLRGHQAPINFAVFSRDARRVVTASDDGTAKIYAIDWALIRPTLVKRSPTIYDSTE